MLAWRACPRCLGRLLTWRYTPDARAPRTLVQARSRAYYNPSFSPRPNTLAAKIWYRKDGMPRSKWKGALFLSILVLFYGMADVVEELDEQKSKLAALVRIQVVDFGFSSADLSTPQGTFKYIGSLYCAVVDETEARKIAKQVFEQYVEYLDSGKLGAEKTEAFHKAGRDTAEGVHTLLQRVQSGDEPLDDVAYDLVKFLSRQLSAIDQTLHGSETMEILNIMASIERKSKSDGYDEVG
ncbi:hypothetical protein APHAL10511_005105 [Amanita phalloides]|nr:hypothetical protein APHAL10511_005105 [Amanita phalloides]